MFVQLNRDDVQSDAVQQPIVGNLFGHFPSVGVVVSKLTTLLYSNQLTRLFLLESYSQKEMLYRNVSLYFLALMLVTLFTFWPQFTLLSVWLIEIRGRHEKMSEEDVFEINDFSTSSDWERFIADLEEILTQWNLGGAGDDVSPIDEVPKTDVITAKLSKLSTATSTSASTSSKLFSDPRLWNQKQEQLKFGKVTFTLTCFTFKRDDEVNSIGDDSVVGDLQSGLRRQSSKSNNSQALSTNRAWHDMNSTAHDWPASGHPLVRYYGFSQFLVLCPLKSETISTEDRIRHLIGSAAIALNNINCEVPFFAQICQPSRRVYSGVLNLNNGFRTCFDMIQFAEVPHSFQYVSDLMNLFKKKLHSSFSYSSVHRDRSTPTHSPSDGPKVAMSIRFTYILSVWPPQYLLFNGNAPNHPALEQFVYFRADFKPQELLIRPAGFGLVANQYADPLKQIQLATTWPSVAEELITDNAYHTDLQPRNAPRWSLRALFMDQPTKCNKLCHTTEWLRAFADLRYQYKTTLLQACKQQQESSGESEVNVRSALDRLAGPSTDQLFKNVSKNVFSQLERNFFAFDSSTSNVEDTVKFLFDYQEGEKIEESNSNCATALKSAPIGSLSWRIALLLANSFAEQHQISTVALIWSTFVDKLRSHWQECTVLPSLESEPVDAIDYGQCLFHQKLQMLNCCIRQKIKRERQQQQQQNSPLKNVNEDDDEGDEDDEFFDCDDEEPERALTDSDKQGQLELLKDSSGEVVNLLDQPNRPIYVPVTQDPAPMTEDHLHKQMQTLASMTSPEESKLKIKLQSAGLLSDMEAFKAANSGARFEDFIRWHSPRDWVELGEEDNNSGGTPNKRESLTKGGIETQFGLSRRMREPNMWLDIWELARAVPVSRQKRLFNYTKEAEEILHWLQTVSVNQFVELLGPIVAKATLGQILQYRDEIRTFVGDNLTEPKDLLLITDLLPFDFGTFEAHFGRGDYDGICLELSAVEYDVVKFYSLLKKVIFAYESEVKKPFKDLYVTVPPLKEEPNVTKQAGVRSGPNRPSFKTGPRSTVSSLTSFQKGDLIQFVTRLLLEPEVEFPSSNCMSTLVVRLFVDSARFQYESSTSVGDRIRMSPEDDDFDHDTTTEHLLEGEQQPKKPTMHIPTPQLPPPAGREFIFRAAAIARPAPYSRPSSQRLYCLMSPKNDFRIATAFTEDVAYF